MAEQAARIVDDVGPQAPYSTDFRMESLSALKGVLASLETEAAQHLSVVD